MKKDNVILKKHGDKNKFFYNFKVDSEYVSPLIGISGCNINRITSTIKNGCYIRAENDIFNISAYSFSALEKAYNMLKNDLDALKNNSIASSKPHGSLKVYNYLVPYIVGKNGDGLRLIMSQVDNGCYIVHKDKEFKITANTTESVDLAIQKINEIASRYLTNHMENRNKSKTKNKKNLSTNISTSNNPDNLINNRKRQSIDRVNEQSINNNDDFMNIDKNDVEYNDVDHNDSIMILSTPPKKIKINNGVWNNTQQTSQVINNVINSDFKDSNKVIQERILEEEKKKEDIINNQIAINIKNGVPATHNLDRFTDTFKKQLFSKSWADMTDDEDDDEEDI